MKLEGVIIHIKLMWVALGALGLFCGYHELVLK